jgi:hypothetical protein
MKLFKEIGRNPHLDWIIIMFLSLLIAVFLAIGGISLYNAVTKGEIQEVVTKPSDSAKNLDKKTLSSVIQRFVEKEEASMRARSGYDGPADPSI